MKTRHIFLIISILMVAIEILLGYLAFELTTIDIATKVTLTIMMLIGMTVSIIMYTMYKDEKQDEYKTYKGNL